MSDSKNVGRFVWYELLTSDPEAAKSFYEAVIGWGLQDWDTPEGAPSYSMWMVGERPIGGVMPLPEEAKAAGAPPHWIANVHVEDVDATVAKAKQLGAQILHGPEDIPKV